METCKGLTVVSHEDLRQAILNWTTAKVLWEVYSEGKDTQRDILWKETPLHKRFWYQFKSGIYTPDEYFNSTDEWVKLNFPKCLRGQLYRYVDGIGGWWSSERYIAEECENHSRSYGTHYLTPKQVVFVGKFKNLDMEE